MIADDLARFVVGLSTPFTANALAAFVVGAIAISMVALLFWRFAPESAHFRRP